MKIMKRRDIHKNMQCRHQNHNLIVIQVWPLFLEANKGYKRGLYITLDTTWYSHWKDNLSIKYLINFRSVFLHILFENFHALVDLNQLFAKVICRDGGTGGRGVYIKDFRDLELKSLCSSVLAVLRENSPSHRLRTKFG